MTDMYKIVCTNTRIYKVKINIEKEEKEQNEEKAKQQQKDKDIESFFNSTIKITENKKDRILRGDLHIHYIQWCQDNKNVIVCKKNDFYKKVEQIYGPAAKIGGNYYFKYRIKI
jgi:hypothetical protein